MIAITGPPLLAIAMKWKGQTTIDGLYLSILMFLGHLLACGALSICIGMTDRGFSNYNTIFRHVLRVYALYQYLEYQLNPLKIVMLQTSIIKYWKKKKYKRRKVKIRVVKLIPQPMPSIDGPNFNTDCIMFKARN